MELISIGRSISTNVRSVYLSKMAMTGMMRSSCHIYFSQVVNFEINSGRREDTIPAHEHEAAYTLAKHNGEPQW